MQHSLRSSRSVWPPIFVLRRASRLAFSASACGTIRQAFLAAFFFVCALFSAATTPQARAVQDPGFRGIVVDQTGAPIAGVDVTLASKSLTSKTSTDTAGRFYFFLAPQSTGILTFTAEGFARLERTVDPKVDRAAELRIVLTPAPLSAQVNVTATRTETRLGETPASIAVLGPTDLQTTAAITLDDALRQVPGFSLFRRSGSRTANPTSQGVSLRGLGASGASRALVLADDLPLNDPFGGWVYWSRVPRDSVSEIEVLRGGASQLYGSSALGGVINIRTRRTEVDALSAEVSYGNQMTPDASVYLGGRRGDWAASLAAESFRTDGYVLVPATERGTIDTSAGSRHAVINLQVERLFGDNQRVFAGTSYFGESRANGTPLQTNRTHIRQFNAGSDWQFARAGSISFRAYGATEVFDQNFTAIAANRNSETLTRVQRVPAQVSGFSAKWARAFGGSQVLVAGFEAHQVRGASNEIVYVAGRASSLVDAGGREATAAGYFEDLIRIRRRVFINLGLRIDHWRNYNALSATRPLTPGSSSLIVFPDRVETVFSPQASVLYKITNNLSLNASGTRAFRAPTLNELYRSFRVGNVLTLANEKLTAERLTGGEGGLRFTPFNGNFVLRGTFFWNQITNPVANVTLTTTPALITRQRQNLGLTRSRGVEIEADARLHRFWKLSAGYLLADATVVRFPANKTLEGLLIPQVARHQFTFQARYANPSLVTFAVQGRAASVQFDDDQNLFRLGSYFTLDAFVSRGIKHGVEVFAAAENLFNQRYEIGKTPVTTLGPPLLVRAGVRLHLGKR